MQGILIEILGFLFKILAISKICHNRIPQSLLSSDICSLIETMPRKFEGSNEIRFGTMKKIVVF